MFETILEVFSATSLNNVLDMRNHIVANFI